MFDPTEKDKFIQMSIDDKRKLYKCGGKFVTIKEINKIKDQIKTLGQSVKKVDSNLNLHITKLSVEEAELFGDKISLWRGDLTRLEIDAIVNAANETLLGGGGVDGAIHSAAGKLLLKECKSLNGCKTGQAKITSGYLLPAKYVIHTVGPIGENSNMLKSCYKSCFDVMKSNNLLTISFPCVSTGIYGYPNEPAARIAIETAFGFLRSEYGKTVNRIIFTLFLEKDVEIYERLMKIYFDSLN